MEGDKMREQEEGEGREVMREQVEGGAQSEGEKGGWSTERGGR